MSEPLELLTRDMGRVLKEAYESGYSTGSRDTHEELIATVEKRRKANEQLDRDTTELFILLTILKSELL